jgi:hypothetical protein
MYGKQETTLNETVRHSLLKIGEDRAIRSGIRRISTNFTDFFTQSVSDTTVTDQLVRSDLPVLTLSYSSLFLCSFNYAILTT